MSIAKRYEAYGWQVLNVADGNDIDAITKAINEAKSEKLKPSIIIVKNEISFGCPAKQGKASAHGEHLGAENIRILVLENMLWQLLLMECMHMVELIGSEENDY